MKNLFFSISLLFASAIIEAQTMQNSSYSTIGYAKDVNKKYAGAAVFFFFFRLNYTKRTWLCENPKI